MSVNDDAFSRDIHPVIPGAERFSATLAEGHAGRLLVNELNCAACHQIPDQAVLSPQVAPKTAPILTNAGGRLHPDYIRRFLREPAAVKPGTMMPKVGSHLSAAQREAGIEALVHFLAASGGPLRQSPAGGAAVMKGRDLFHKVGCVACHGPIDQESQEAASADFVVPLGALHEKYGLPGLTAYLRNPHAIRPSGRMPSMNLTDEEANAVASFLLKDSEVPANLPYQVFHGDWQEMPDLDQLTAVSEGLATQFDVRLGGRSDRFALRFEGYFQAPADGDYEFHLGSDDGSRLSVDGRRLIDNDGIHPHSTRSARITLKKGPHPIRVDYFEYSGQESLSVDVNGPGLPRQSAAGLISSEEKPSAGPGIFQPVPELAEAGRRLFADWGCASCHQHGVGDQQIATVVKSVPVRAESLDSGCLAAGGKTGRGPDFGVSPLQAAQIRAAWGAPVQAPQSADADGVPDNTLLALNCYACHDRGGIGGVPRELEALFQGTIPEMGDEGRIPPSLNGAGDKLQASWISHVLNNGAKDRPYMHTRMPRFGADVTGHLPARLAEADRQAAVPEINFDVADHRVLSEARTMVGDQALGCVKCHTFGKYAAIGLQSLDMTTMSRRLRRDWFHRYLNDPQAYRPGTRMPAAWPKGRSVVPHILDGTANQQIEAIWRYLQDGDKAALPTGLKRDAIDLTPTEQPRIYRNFFDGVSARGIAVGLPEGVHYIWDAEACNLKTIWHGAFVDASLHWNGRGVGRTGPIGDHVFQLDSPGLLMLPSAALTDDALEFRGYVLGDDRRPVFLIQSGDVLVQDSIKPRETQQEPGLRRSLSFRKAEPGKRVSEALRVAVVSGSTMEERVPGSFRIDDSFTIEVEEGKASVIATGDGQLTLIIEPNRPAAGTIRAVYSILW